MANEKQRNELLKSLSTKERKEQINSSTDELQKSIFQSGSSQSEVAKNIMEAGYGITPETQIDGGALKVESLDPVLKNLTWGTNDFTILRDLLDLNPIQARSTVEKYIVFNNHGRTGHSLFQPEVGIGNLNMPHMTQKTLRMKNLVDTRATSFIQQATATVDDAARINEDDAVAVMAKTQEWAIFHGDADITSGEKGEGLEFDGLDKLIPAENVIDLRGGSLTPEILNKASVKIAKSFGTATDAYMPIGVKADFGNNFLGAQRIAIPSATNAGMSAGFSIDSFISANGLINLNGSTLMDIDSVLDTTHTPAANAPAPATVAATVKTGANGMFRTEVKSEDGSHVLSDGEVGKELSYRVVVIGRSGDSLASEIVKATPANEDDGIELKVSLAALQGDMPEGIAFYRQGLHSEEFYLIGRVGTNTMADDNTITFTDINENIPETADVYVLEMRSNVIGMYQFIPFTKFDLARVTTANQFAVMWSGALALFNPNRAVKIKSVRQNLATGNDENHLNGVNASGYAQAK